MAALFHVQHTPPARLRLFHLQDIDRRLAHVAAWFAGQQAREVAERRRLHSNQCVTAMKNFLLLLFTWWNRQTFGTWVTTWLWGESVGEDEFGNHYYRTKGGKIDKAVGFERRWVVFSGYAEGSTIPPSWHGWMHHTVDTPPTQQNYTPHAWQKPHRPNPTGTPAAVRPSGSTLASGRRPKATGDYKAWSPK